MVQASVQLVDYGAMARQIWSRLTAAAEDRNHPMRLIVVATIDHNLRPALRTLVLRGADREHARLWFYTDLRSRKVAEINVRPHISALAYDEVDGVQLRLDGRARVRHEDAFADRHWAQVDMTARYDYAVEKPPGEPIAEPDPLGTLERIRASKGLLDDGRRHFAVIELELDTIEWFQTTSLGQRRALLRRSDAWTVCPLTA